MIVMPSSAGGGPETMKPVVARVVKGVIGEFEAERPFLFDR